ncbi:MAG: UvrD-helicase domain-containing protein, partial [Dehalococcoidia bacterium]|nr:UvrD-helicase domain-containing protein [Dehalococcoidia bacterium]
DRIGHQAIAASAGAGKTFQLAHRYMRLLANEVRPDQINALTFSRKAAGEIFDSIVKYLREAAVSAEQARKTGELIGKPEFGQAHFLRLLRTLLVNLHRLHVSTLDSFTVGVIRTFPMELGISTDLQLLDNDGAAAKSARQEALDRIFDNRYVDAVAQRQFLEAFKQATFGQEEKGLERSLGTFIGDYHSYYQVLPAPDAWGLQDVIWPGGSPWLAVVDDVNAVADDLEALLAKDRLSDSVRGRWHTFIDAVRRFDAGSSWTRDVEYLFGKLVDDIEGLRHGNATVRIDKTDCDLSSEEGRLALVLLTHVMKTELGTALEKTRGIYRVLDQYEQVYDDVVRRQGKLTFTDAQYLLTAANSYSGGSLLSRAVGEEARLYIDYRLDCKLDHWLLDEFQDTSDLQWEVLRNLADEILQDTTGQRSFFYVGDVKQAIYGWRGGNARLFGKILEQYPGQIEQVPLNTSFRSCQPVIDTVNRVFGHVAGSELLAGAITEWQKIWEVHQCQEDVVPQHGYVGLLEPPCEGGEVKPTDGDRYRVVARLLKEIDPLSRGLSVVILVRTNKSGKEVVNFLRGECQGMNIVHEGRAAIKDNPVVSLLLSLVKFAAHPGDAFAWRHLEMSPIGECLAEERLDRDNLPLALLREIQMSGFQALIRHWGRRLDGAHPLDGFGRKRLEDLIGAAGEFDVSGSHDCNAFLRFVDNYEIDELAADDAVRVMTIHQAKGLGFDMVILPDLQGRGMTGGGQLDFVTARDPGTSRPVWAFKMPRRIIAKNESVLTTQVQASDETACFEELCLLYVALTRARQALYIITSFRGKTATAVTAAAFLKAQLTGEAKPVDGEQVTINGEEFVCLYEAGESGWYTRAPQREQPVEPAGLRELPRDFGRQSSHRRRLVRVSPSERAEGEQTAGSLFARDVRDSREFGKAVHELFEKVSWIGEADVEELIGEWRQRSPVAEDVKQMAVEHFRRALACAEVRQALSRSEGDVDLWREKRFDIVLDDQWVTGVFDRVAIVRGRDGKPLRATVLDFKSDEIASDAELTEAAERYRSQLLLYGSALSRMLELDPSQVRLRLLFTHPGRVHDLKLGETRPCRPC